MPLEHDNTAESSALARQLRADPRVQALMQQYSRGNGGAYKQGLVPASALQQLGYDVPDNWTLAYGGRAGYGQLQDDKKNGFEKAVPWIAIGMGAAGGLGAAGLIPGLGAAGGTGAGAATGAGAGTGAAAGAGGTIPFSTASGVSSAALSGSVAPAAGLGAGGSVAAGAGAGTGAAGMPSWLDIANLVGKGASGYAKGAAGQRSAMENMLMDREQMRQIGENQFLDQSFKREDERRTSAADATKRLQQYDFINQGGTQTPMLSKYSKQVQGPGDNAKALANDPALAAQLMARAQYGDPLHPTDPALSDYQLNRVRLPGSDNPGDVYGDMAKQMKPGLGEKIAGWLSWL